MKKIFVIVTTVMFAFCYSLSAENNDDLVKVKIYSNVKQLQRGADFYLALEMNITDDWHVYWENPGDSGLPTEVKWETPKGVEKDGDLIWQVPEKIKWSDMINYGYSHKMYLIQKFKTTRISDAQEIKIKAKLNWLVCKEKCIPQDKDISIDLKVGETFIKSDQDKLINELLASAPVTFESKNSTFDVDDDNLSIELLDKPKDLQSVTDIYFVTAGITDNTHKTKIV
ncbi:hypothetical protein EP342_00760, partial [bacterium]